MTWWDGRVAFVILPPFVKGAVGTNVKALFGWGSFSKCIAYIGAEHKHILGSGNSIEEAQACLIDTVSVNLIKNID
jgi:hypothetical protein